MDRREALKLTTGFFGTSIFGSQLLLSGCFSPGKPKGYLNEADIPLLNALADVILPSTSNSPGAGEAAVGKFIFSIVEDCYTEEEARVFENGIRKLETTSEITFDKSFLELSREEQTQILSNADEEALEYEKKGNTHYYTMLLQLVIWGYFISEPGATKSLRYNPIPGRFEGCIPYQKDQPAWA